MGSRKPARIGAEIAEGRSPAIYEKLKWAIREENSAEIMELVMRRERPAALLGVRRSGLVRPSAHCFSFLLGGAERSAILTFSDKAAQNLRNLPIYT